MELAECSDSKQNIQHLNTLHVWWHERLTVRHSDVWFVPMDPVLPVNNYHPSHTKIILLLEQAQFKQRSGTPIMCPLCHDVAYSLTLTDLCCQEERQKRLGPGGLDPVEVFESLPKVRGRLAICSVCV